MSESMTVEQKMARSVETWRKCDPILMASQSQAALIFAFRDMKRDILVLADEVGRLQARVAELESQLPEGMKHCTIQFRECEKGHGWLTASNWVQHECATCERDELRRQVDDAVLLDAALFRWLIDGPRSSPVWNNVLTEEQRYGHCDIRAAIIAAMKGGG